MIGSSISRYRILERLGGGGMGEVYKAEDLRLGRLVALKLLKTRRESGEEERRRFLHEARAASALDHPNVCAVHEIGETEDGRLFLALAFCEGENLGQRIARGPLPVPEAVDRAVQIAAGLEAIHARGIVHRDIKPANILVTSGGQVRIADFGIARLAEGTRLTRPGAILGTAGYVAPEVLLGREADARADLWSLGAVLYEMLTGGPPFRAQAGGADRDLASQILQVEPRAPSAVRPGVPRALDRIVARALAKDPVLRYQSAAELRAELLLAAGEPGGRQAEDAAGVEDVETNLEIPLPETAESDGPAGFSVPNYRVLERLGGGAMGMVYRAKDLRLARTVALKLLLPELTRDPEAKARFLQEARAASGLDHPNLCTIYEVGETASEGLFLAMPCYDGESLRQRLRRGPLPVEEAADIALQAARGLAKAHRHGIIHRDVKPANLMVTGDGVVKILDFGIAKLAGEATLTRQGTSPGTPAYMSPEQVRGEEVDARTDLWSLGVVLYEMLAGRRPFRGERDEAVLYAILHSEPEPLGEAAPNAPIPPELERIVTRLLEKDRERRWSSAGEVAAELRLLAGGSSGSLASGGAAAPARPKRRMAGAAAIVTAMAAVAVVALLAVAGWRLFRPAGPPSEAAGDIAGDTANATFTRLTDQEGPESFPSLSPAGDFFLYTSAVTGNSDIYLQRVGGGKPIDLTADSPADDTQPAFSPDGQQIAFRSERDGGGIFVMGATGESVRRVTDFGFRPDYGYLPAWSPDGRQLLVSKGSVADPAVRQAASTLWIVDVATGAKRRIRSEDAIQGSWSPDGRRIAYWGIPAGTGRRVIWTVAAEGGEPAVVVDDGHLNWNPVWSPDGRSLLYASDRGGTMNLWQVAVDPETGEAAGEPEPVTTPAPWSAFLSLSKDGRRIAYAVDERKVGLVRFALDPVREAVSPGTPGGTSVLQGPRAIRSAKVSPDGGWIAFDTSAPQEDLFLVRQDGSGLRQLTQDAFKDRLPRWSPDGSRILFYSNRSGNYEAWTVRLDGSGLEQVTEVGSRSLNNPIWSPDGRRLAAYLSPTPVWLDLGKPADARKLLPLPVRSGGTDFAPVAWSADGQWLAGVGARSALTTYSFASQTSQALPVRAQDMVWLRDSRRLLCLIDGSVFLVDGRTGRSRRILAPPPGSAYLGLDLGADDRALYLVEIRYEGDIWLLSR